MTKNSSTIITINLNDFTVEHPASNCGSMQYKVSTGLAVRELDESGFVTEVEGFILDARKRRYDTPDDVAQWMIDQGKKFVGERLLAVTTLIHPLVRNAKPVEKTWRSPKHPETPAVKGGFHELKIPSTFAKVDLVTNAVCGGYDGRFRYEMNALVRRPRDRREFVEKLGNAFTCDTYKASCEELALGLVHAACTLYENDLVSVTPRVYNRTGHVDATWHTGWKTPPFLRSATFEEIEETRIARRDPERILDRTPC